jgi:tRNA-specific adenosine deaminase 1
VGKRQRFAPKQQQQQRSRTDGAHRAHSDKSANAVPIQTQAIRVPSVKTLRWVAFTTGLPFIGFGFMDNAILIIAGDAIDTSLGVSLGISTLCAAAIGNIISDLAGIGCAAYIEEFCATTLKLPIPRLSSAQRQLRSVRMASQGGMAIGMTIGCILGMLPLLFIDANKADRLRERARLKRLYQDVLNEAKTLVEAESTCLYLRVDKDAATAAPKREGDGILPDYHPSVNGEYLYAMFYVEPTDQQRAAGGRNSMTTDTLMRMVSSGARINSSGNSSNTNNTDGGGSSDGASAVDASRDKRKITIPSSVTRQKDSGGIGMAVAPPDGPRSPPEPHPTRVIPIGKGIVSRAVLTGTTWNIAGNLIDEPDFYPLSIETTATTVGSDSNRPDRERFRDGVVVPILDGKGRVIAVLEAINKERRQQHSGDNKSNYNGDDGGFTDQDVEILMSLASHVSVSLQKIYQDGGEKNEDDEFGLRDTIRILKEGKGIKRSITRRASNAGSGGGRSSTGSAICDGDDQDNTIAAANTTNTYPSTAGRKKVQLFPD